MQKSARKKRALAAVAITASLVMGTIAWPDLPSAQAASSAQQVVQSIESTQTAEVKYGVNMRASASSSSKIYRMLKKGEQVQILSKVNSNWYKVKDKNGKVGYVSTNSKYLSLSNTTAGEGNSAGTDGNNSAGNENGKDDTIAGTSAKVIYGVNFRTQPNASSKVIRMLPKGESVTILGQEGSNWYKIKDGNGTTGYVSSNSKYLSLNGQTVPGGNNGGSSGNNNTGGNSNGSGSTGSGNVDQSNATVEKVIAAGMKYLGTPYEFGSNRNSTKTFDCSAFVQRAFLDATGKKLPGDSRKQGQYVKDKGNAKTSISSLKRGDLMFFMSYKGSSASSYSGVNKSTQRITHVGIYLGNNQILHTYSKESGGVKTNNIKGTHWEHRFLYGGSAL